MAIDSYGDFGTTRTALEFLKKFQRADGKIPHEISQSASIVPWFTDYDFPWNSADGSPLYVIVHGDHWRATGDKDFLKTNWDSIVRPSLFLLRLTLTAIICRKPTGTSLAGWVEGGGLSAT